MPYVAANTQRVQERVVSIIHANPDSYSQNVSGKNRRFPSNTEILNAILEADGEIIQDYIDTSGHPLRPQFMVSSANLVNGAQIGAHLGDKGAVELSPNGTVTWNPSLEGKSKAEVLEIGQQTSLYGDAATDYDCWHWVEDNRIYHTAAFARIWTPNVVRTSVCQAHEGHEPAIISGAAEMLLKDGGTDVHAYYGGQSKYRRQLIREGVMVVPDIQEYNRATRNG